MKKYFDIPKLQKSWEEFCVAFENAPIEDRNKIIELIKWHTEL